MRIAAILTCFNRKEKTLKCLDSLLTMHPDIEVFLTDDGSTDGTGEAVTIRFPKVNIIRGDGNLYWNRGMYMAWKKALSRDYDYYLLLNDDTVLYPDFLEQLFECETEGGGECIITGILESEDKQVILYGGRDKNKVRLKPSERLQPVYIMNANVVLVPSCVVKRIGIFDPILHHDLGDHDYGLTAIENGISIYVTHRAVGIGEDNTIKRMRKWGVGLKERIRYMQHPLASPPKINFYFRRKHFGIFHAIAFVSRQIVLNILPDYIVKFIAPKYK